MALTAYLCVGLAYLLVDMYLQGDLLLAQILRDMDKIPAYAVPLVVLLTTLITLAGVALIVLAWPAFVAYDVYTGQLFKDIR